MKKHLTLFLVAGEPSGDALGARLMTALRELTDGAVEFRGVGGPAMQDQGLETLFGIDELAVMGIVEVLPHARRLFRRMSEVAAAVESCQPEAIITIDAPTFAHGVIRRLRSRDIVRIHYVAPQLWAWRPWRVAKFKRDFDRVLALLPFEPAWFAARGLDCRFVGHPAIEAAASTEAGANFRVRHGISPDARVLCVLPGSRRNEVARHVGPFGGAVDLLAATMPDLVVLLPTLPGLRPILEAASRGWRVRAVVVETAGERRAAMAASNAAIAASGTVTIELAAAGVPSAVAYRVNWISYWLGRMLIRVDHIALINVLLQRRVMPEFIQDECEPQKLVTAVRDLLADGGKLQVRETALAVDTLGRGGEAPSVRAAREVLAAVHWQRRTPCRTVY